MTPNTDVALNTTDIAFTWKPELELFVVRQFAEFVNPYQIALNVMNIYYDECEPDLNTLVEAHGGGEEAAEKAQQMFANFLLRRIYNLSPKNVNFPKKYQGEYSTWRAGYLTGLDESYLYHSRNRQRELDKLYQKAESTLNIQTKGSDVRACVAACVQILEQSRIEANKTSMDLEATNKEGTVKISLHTYLSSLPPEKIMEIKEKIASGQPIDLPDTVDAGYSINPPENGSGQGTSGQESGNGSTETSDNPATKG